LPPLSLQAQAPGDYTYGVLTGNYHPQGAGIAAINGYDGTALGADFPTLTENIGLYAGVSLSTGIAAVLDQRAGSGKALSVRSNGTENASIAASGNIATAGNITATGSVTAASFTGSGSGLTGVNAATLNGQAAASYATASDLSSEATTRAAADTTLNTAISGETTRATTAENKLAVRGITYIAGCDSCNLLQTNDSEKAIYLNVIGAMTINQVTCISDTGSPTISLQRDNGSLANVLSEDLICQPGSGATTTTTITTPSLALGERLDFYVTGGVGAAHRVTVVIKATIN
jgi:trimeric autotransporter adhesin